MKYVLDDINEMNNNGGHFSMPARICRYICENIDIPPQVLEIGTGYGSHLPFFAPLCERVVCIDPMYDWVPDIRPDVKFDPTLTDQAKLDEWEQHAAPFRDKVELIIGVSHEVEYHFLNGPFDIVIIDGCHHPWQAVAEDYLRLRHIMATPHYAIFDDTQSEDPKVAVRELEKQLTNEKAKFRKKHVETKWKNLPIFADVFYVE